MQPNVNSFGNAAEPIAANLGVALFGPSAAAALGGGVFTVPENHNGDIVFQIAGISSETMAVTVSYDGTNYSAALKPFNITNGVIVASADLAAGKYSLKVKEIGSPRYVKFTKSATTEVGAVAIAVPGAAVRI